LNGRLTHKPLGWFLRPRKHEANTPTAGHESLDQLLTKTSELAKAQETKQQQRAKESGKAISTTDDDPVTPAGNTRDINNIGEVSDAEKGTIDDPEGGNDDILVGITVEELTLAHPVGKQIDGVDMGGCINEPMSESNTVLTYKTVVAAESKPAEDDLTQAEESLPPVQAQAC
jgi:hypothetical protein